MKIQIIIGSTRPNRFSEKPALWIYKEALKRKNLDIEVVDLRDYPLPYYNESLPPKALKGKYTDPVAILWAQKVSEADGYIIVTPEYNHGYPAVLKNALDYVYTEWNRKPVGFISYGGVSGARAIEQLRQVAIELQMAPIQTSLNIPSQVFMASMKQNDTSSAFDSLNDRAELFLDDLTWWAYALKNAKKQEFATLSL